ncbi:helix-turn-helix domain-containing protein [Methylomonas sp. LL1]|uniref:Crp/Fnr family transcriptional regulator n=1 Tax=Methylomonas sp. LL1 TaxID=2785785 RepID=UPI0018C37518|nr:helix-turn-helix domain-containing protein [Methylomonas sp. LL1]QPK64895.1 helix-turn-helix domain-containing protein [Methylomonas sp. LL1]
MNDADYLSPILRRCHECGKKSLCLADDLVGNRIDINDRNLIRDRIHEKGNCIFYQGDGVKSLFFVKSGSVKSIYTSGNGDQQIINFHFPGEVIELLPLNHSCHSSSAITLEKSVICAFSLHFILAYCEKLPSLLNNIQTRVNVEIEHQHEVLLSSNHRIANKRLGIFLLDMVYRQHLKQANSARLQLTMSRADMANYLGLAPETVSRVLADYEKQGLILANKKKIQIPDLNRLIKFIS